MKTRGLLSTSNDLHALMARYPKADFFMVARNFNDVGNFDTFGLFIEGEDDNGRVYLNNANLREFLPGEVSSKLCNTVAWQTLRSVGQQLADEMGRKIVLIHRHRGRFQHEATHDEQRFRPAA